MLEVELEDGRREIVRALVQGHDSEMFESEVALLAWLSRRTLLPVPRLRCVVGRSTTGEQLGCGEMSAGHGGHGGYQDFFR